MTQHFGGDNHRLFCVIDFTIQLGMCSDIRCGSYPFVMLSVTTTAGKAVYRESGRLFQRTVFTVVVVVDESWLIQATVVRLGRSCRKETWVFAASH